MSSIINITLLSSSPYVSRQTNTHEYSDGKKKSLPLVQYPYIGMTRFRRLNNSTMKKETERSEANSDKERRHLPCASLSVWLT